MSCPEHDATIAWINGEGPEDHAAHVAACPACSAELDLQERVGHALADVAPALRATTVRPARTRWVTVAAVAAMAALALIAVYAHGRPDPTPPAPVLAAATLDDPAIDVALDDLDGDMSALSDDLDSL